MGETRSDVYFRSNRKDLHRVGSIIEAP